MMWNDQDRLFVWILFVNFNSLGIKHSSAQDHTPNEVLNGTIKKFEGCIDNHKIPCGEKCDLNELVKFLNEWIYDSNKLKNVTYLEGIAKRSCFGIGQCDFGTNRTCSECDVPSLIIQSNATDCGTDFDNWQIRIKQFDSFKKSADELDKCLKYFYADQDAECYLVPNDFLAKELNKTGTVCKSGYVPECYAKIPIDLHVSIAKGKCTEFLECEKIMNKNGSQGVSKLPPEVFLPEPDLQIKPSDGCKDKLGVVKEKHKIAAAPPGTPIPPVSTPGSKTNSTSSHLHFEFLLIVPVFFIAATDLNSLFS